MRGDAHDSARRLALAGTVLARIRALPPARVRDRAFARMAARLASSPIPEHRKIAAALGGALAAGDPAAALALASTAGRRADRRAAKIVSHRYRFLWLCNPRVASRSPIQALMASDPDAELIRGRTLEEIPGLRPALGAYFSLAFVRLPVGRTRSFHADKHGLALHDRRTYRWFIEPWHGLRRGMRFDELCRRLATSAGSDAVADRHWLSQHAQIGTRDGRLPDFVGRWETLDDDWRTVAAHTGRPHRVLPSLNARRGAVLAADVAETPQAAALLRRRCAEEFRLSGYAP